MASSQNNVYSLDFVELYESVRKMRLRARLLAERGIQLPKAPSKRDREAAAAAPVPMAVSEGDVVTRQGPLSQPGKKETSVSEPALAESSEVPSPVPNKGTSAPTPGRDNPFSGATENSTGSEKEEELERAVQQLCCTAIMDACKELRKEQSLLKELKKTLHNEESLHGETLKLNLQNEESKPSLQNDQSRPSLEDKQAKPSIHNEQLKDLASMKDEQSKPSPQQIHTKPKGWKRRGKRVARRLRKAFANLMSCFWPSVSKQ